MKVNVWRVALWNEKENSHALLTSTLNLCTSFFLIGTFLSIKTQNMRQQKIVDCVRRVLIIFNTSQRRLLQTYSNIKLSYPLKFLISLLLHPRSVGLWWKKKGPKKNNLEFADSSCPPTMCGGLYVTWVLRLHFKKLSFVLIPLKNIEDFVFGILTLYPERV